MAQNGAVTTRDVAHAYLAAWTAGDVDALRPLLAEDVTVECKLTGAGDGAHLVEALGRLAAAVDGVTVVSENYADGGAMLLYDCAVGSGTMSAQPSLPVM